ncbi:MAG: glycosyltransferase family 4 protein [Candidatus Promineifilaceae bacterium]|nr:glycosyltransferase family 4 protein [Candidatus Promineifilaceae bacterium]
MALNTDTRQHSRVLVLSTWNPFPPTNGSRIRAYHLIRALASKYDVTLLAFAGHANGEPFTEPRRDWPGLKIFPVMADPYRHVVRSRPIRYLSPIPLSYWRSSHMSAVVEETMAKGSFELQVALGIPAARHLRDYSTPTIVDVDTSLSFALRERYQAATGSLRRLATWLSWAKAAWLERRILRPVAACTVVARHERPYLQRLVGNAVQVKVSPNGVDCYNYQPQFADKVPNRLIYNGALTYDVNFEAMRYFLAAVYPRIRRHEPDVELYITGRTDGVTLSSLALDDSVHLTGFVDEIGDVVGRSTVAIAPIWEGGGTRIKILEAMALGTPVVSTSKGAEGLMVEPEEEILLADDADRFASQTIRLLNNPELRMRVAQRARRLVERHYDWRDVGEAFCQLIEQVAEQHSRPRLD